MIRPLTGNVPWSVTVTIAQAECLLGRAGKYVIGQKPYDGSETLETSAAVSEARFTRYNEIREKHKEVQTSAASYGWLLASIRMSWYIRYHGWKKLTAPVLLFQAEKDAFSAGGPCGRPSQRGSLGRAAWPPGFRRAWNR